MLETTNVPAVASQVSSAASIARRGRARSKLLRNLKQKTFASSPPSATCKRSFRIVPVVANQLPVLADTKTQKEKLNTLVMNVVGMETRMDFVTDCPLPSHCVVFVESRKTAARNAPNAVSTAFAPTDYFMELTTESIAKVEAAMRNRELEHLQMQVKDLQAKLEASERRRDEVKTQITDYLVCGGLINPEMMDHEKVRDLLLAIRAVLATETAKVCCRCGEPNPCACEPATEGKVW